MYLNKFIDTNYAKLAVQIYQNKVFEFEINPIDFTVNYKRDFGRIKDEHWRNEGIKIVNKGMAEFLSLMIFSKFYGNGPKVLKLEQLDFEAMEQVDINIEVSDYAQPFDTLCIEFPENYQRKKTIGTLGLEEFCKTDKQWPLSIIVHLEGNVIFGQLLFSSGCLHVLLMNGNHQETISTLIDKCMAAVFNDSKLIFDEEETKVAKDCFNAALNTCLYLDDFGIKNRGPENPSYYKRLQRYKKTEQNDFDLLTQPMIFGFNQEVHIFKREGTNEKGQRIWTGEPVKPHWRRGHYRMQPYGAHNSLRKRIRVAPVLVNSKLFKGDLESTKVVYR